MKVGWIVRRLGQIVRREGWRSLWFRAWAAAGYQRTGFLVCDLARATRSGDAVHGVELRVLSTEDGPAYVAFRRGATLEDFFDRLRRGFRCHAAWCDGRLASVTWTATGRAVLWLLDAEFDIPPHRVYLFDSFTLEEFRGRRLQAAVFAHVREAALAVGIIEAVTFVVPENQPNMRSRSRLGFERRGTVGRWRIGPWRRYFRRGDAPLLRRRCG